MERLTNKDIVHITLKQLAKQVFSLHVNQTIGFSIEQDSNHWGITKINRFGTDLLLMGPHGGNGVVSYDLNSGDEIEHITEFLTYSLRDETGDDVYMEIKIETTHQLWGIVYDYRPNKDEKWLKTLCQDTYDSQEEAEKNRDGSIAEDMKVHDYNENQETQNIQVVLIYEWEE